MWLWFFSTFFCKCAELHQFIDMWKLNHPYIPGTISTRLWCTTLYWRFNLLVFSWEYLHLCSWGILGCIFSSFNIHYTFLYQLLWPLKQTGNIPSSSIFWKKSVKISTIYSLHIWLNSPMKLGEFHFVRNF